MTLTEVLQALLDGKKLRYSDWAEEEFVHLKDDKFIDERGKDYYLYDLLDSTEDLSIVECDAIWAIKQLLNGNVITSPEWCDTIALRDSGGEVVNWNEYNKEDTYSVV